MGVALQAGVLAGGVVFVPMALAGWRLTRNRVLFFSAALFIVLAVSVHLQPYFPTMSSLLDSLHSPWPYVTVVNSAPPVVTPPVNCLLHVHDLVWEDTGSRYGLSDDFINPGLSRQFHWSRTGNAAGFCRYAKLNSRDMVDLFRGAWIVIAGDSQVRLFFMSLLDLLMPNANPARVDIPQKHSDYEYKWEEENITFQYRWMPFTANLTSLIVEYRRNLTYPDVLIMGGGLWHMLYSANSTPYGLGLARLRKAILSLFPSRSLSSESQPFGRIDSRDALQAPHMFWLNHPTLVSSLLNTETKRDRMGRDACGAYDAALMESNLVHPGGPLTLIDLKKISRGCGYRCTIDGMHYNNATYEAAVHVMVNTLLIATQQSPAA